jgi:hypothetical protein
MDGLPGQLQAATALLPPALGGAPSQPLNLGRATRVVSPAQRHALAVRDRGGVVPDCDRPLAWCDDHHLQHWADGGPTNLDNLALLCRAHHRAVHEDGWQLTRGPNGRFSATPPIQDTATPPDRGPGAARPTVPGTGMGPERPRPIGHRFRTGPEHGGATVPAGWMGPECPGTVPGERIMSTPDPPGT